MARAQLQPQLGHREEQVLISQVSPLSKPLHTTFEGNCFANIDSFNFTTSILNKQHLGFHTGEIKAWKGGKKQKQSQEQNHLSLL